jgi:alpha-beta hydrolase superfamily lysophospholipase
MRQQQGGLFSPPFFGRLKMIAAAYDQAAIQAEIRYLDECSQQYPQAVQMYFEHYGLDYPDVEHRFGWFQSRGLKLAGHVWTPVGQGPTLQETSDMVIVVHGYLNHTGQLKHLIGALLANGYTVGSFDLPGHGLSEGKAAAVGAFGDYTTALLDFTLATRSMYSGRLHLVGFSTGATVVVDLLRNHAQAEACACHPEEHIFDKIVLAGPLIRWRGYQASKALYALYSPFTDTISRLPQKNSSDENFLSFNRNDDYLHCRSVSLEWAKAVYDWNERIETMPSCDKEILIVQGSRDTTVDWRYNLKLLGEKFPAARAEMIKGARHELFNESEALRDECQAKIIRYLSSE